MSLIERANRVLRENPGLTALRPVVIKELIHYDIFFHMTQSNLMPQNMVFIGGTCLRLCHNSNRFSEDLDFHAGTQFQPSDFDRLRESLERFLHDSYGMPVEVKEPKQNSEDPNYANTLACTWKVIIQTSPANASIPAQRVHIDIANIPTHEAEVDVLKTNYTGLPDGYDNIIIRRSSANEILADKIIALGARNNIKARDLWDIQWLHQIGNTIDLNLVKQKIGDHQIDNFTTLLARKRLELNSYWDTNLFPSEMSRFLDSNRLANTVKRPEFIEVMKRETDRHIRHILNHFSGNLPEFDM